MLKMLLDNDVEFEFVALDPALDGGFLKETPSCKLNFVVHCYLQTGVQRRVKIALGLEPHNVINDRMEVVAESCEVTGGTIQILKAGTGRPNLRIKWSAPSLVDVSGYKLLLHNRWISEDIIKAIQQEVARIYQGL